MFTSSKVVDSGVPSMLSRVVDSEVPSILSRLVDSDVILLDEPNRGAGDRQDQGALEMTGE